MTVVISAITPQRLRGNGSTTITGTGFGTAGNNQVLINGSSATLGANGTTSIVVTGLGFLFSSGIVDDIHALGQVINLTTGESAYFYLRIKPFTVADTADQQLVGQRPGRNEIPGVDRGRIAEAVDAERLSALIELVTLDPDGGQVLSFDGASPALPGGSSDRGAVLMVDTAEVSDLRWAGQQDTILRYAATLPSASTQLLIANADRSQPTGTGEDEQWVPLAGTIDLAWLLVRSAAFSLDRVRILRNGSSIYDSGTALGITDSQVWSAAPNVAVALNDRLEMEVTGVGGVIEVIGGLRLIPT